MAHPYGQTHSQGNRSIYSYATQSYQFLHRSIVDNSYPDPIDNVSVLCYSELPDPVDYQFCAT